MPRGRQLLGDTCPALRRGHVRRCGCWGVLCVRGGDVRGRHEFVLVRDLRGWLDHEHGDEHGGRKLFGLRCGNLQCGVERLVLHHVFGGLSH